MKLIIDTQEHHDWIFDQISKEPKNAIITTFGLWAGILHDGRDTSEWGEEYQLQTRQILDKLQHIKTAIIVGIGEYKSCKGQKSCLDCERQYAKTILRINNHALAYPDIKWRVTSKLHIKMVIFEHQNKIEGITGGRNFTNSDWEDCTVVLDEKNCNILKDHARKLWKLSKDINDATVGEILEEQGVTMKALERL